MNKIEDFTTALRSAGYGRQADALERYVCEPFVNVTNDESSGAYEDFYAIAIKPAMSRWNSFVANKIWQQIYGAPQNSKLDRTCAKIAEFLLQKELVYADYDLDVQPPEKDITAAQTEVYNLFLSRLRC